MSKKTYIIEISGESGGSCFRELSKSEYELISGILEDCNSEYVGGTITECFERYGVILEEKYSYNKWRGIFLPTSCGYSKGYYTQKQIQKENNQEVYFNSIHTKTILFKTEEETKKYLLNWFDELGNKKFKIQ